MAASHLPEDALSRVEIEALMCACSHRAATGVRNTTLFAVLWRCGLRLGAALAHRSQDMAVCLQGRDR